MDRHWKASPTRVVIGVLGTLASVSFAFLAVYALVISTGSTAPVAAGLDQTERLQILEEVRARAEGRLDTYAWVEGEEETARIPIERAMELIETRYATTEEVPR